MVLTGLKVPMQTVGKRYGLAVARRLFQCSLESIRTVETLVREEKIECGFARNGHLMVANKPEHYAGLAGELEFLAREFNHEVDLLPPDQLHAEIGSSAYFGGLVDRQSAGLNPAQYVAGLARSAAAAGASLQPRSKVMQIRRVAGDFEVETVRGTLRAERVFVATSGYTGGFARSLRRRIIPIGSFIIATEKLPERIATELIPRDRMVFDTRHYLNYFRLWENRVVFGGRAAFFPENERTIRQSASILRQQMVTSFPQLKDTKVEYAWGGTLDFAFDMMTHVGELDGLVFSLGYAGHGVAMATYLGQTVADAMIDNNLKDHPFAAVPLPTAPLGLYNGWPWFLPFAGLYYKILDWIE
jgi:glycine/D-amino acid oxidase-like deaminating enzyme